MPVYRDGFENEICFKGEQGNFQYMPEQMRLPFLDAVKQYFSTIYLFISILYFVLVTVTMLLDLHGRFLFWGF